MAVNGRKQNPPTFFHNIVQKLFPKCFLKGFREKFVGLEHFLNNKTIYKKASESNKKYIVSSIGASEKIIKKITS